MNAPGRCEALPAGSGPAAITKSPLSSRPVSPDRDFDSLLDSHSESSRSNSPFVRPLKNGKAGAARSSDHSVEGDDENARDSERKSEEKKNVDSWIMTGSVPLFVPTQLTSLVPAPVSGQASAIPPGSDLPGNQPTGTAPEAGSEALTPPVPGSTGPIQNSETPAEAPSNGPDTNQAEFSLSDLLRPAGEQKMPVSPLVPPPTKEQNTLNASQEAKKARGIPVAQQAAMPEQSAQSKSDAGVTPAQALPLENFESSSFEHRLRFSDESFENKPGRSERETSFGSLEFTSLKFPGEPLRDLSDSSTIKPAAPVIATATTEAIRSHVQLLRTSGQNLLEVTLRPDAQTEIFLHVTKVNGQVQVQARCERGDFELLGAHWSSVQDSLSASGIRVEPLQPAARGENQAFAGFSGQPQNQNRSGHQDRRLEHDFPFEQDFKTSKARPQAAGGARVRGWQTWA